MRAMLYREWNRTARTASDRRLKALISLRDLQTPNIPCKCIWCDDAYGGQVKLHAVKDPFAMRWG